MAPLSFTGHYCREREHTKFSLKEKRQELLQRKNQQEKLERERQRTKMLEEISAKEIEKRQCDERAKEKYNLWLEKKKEEEIVKKQIEKEEAELKERREMADKKFKEWLRSAKDKPRPASSPCGYSNGKPTGFYDQNYYPAPSFCNPIPWKPIHAPPPEESSRKQAVKKTQKQRSFVLQRHTAAVSCKPKDNLGIGLVRQVRR
ncbi:coiled-coil domain-containing protein 34-like [Polypterus senegalus]|uniref:coiled-coil domain-containing protein 34-like n=1 Tax=Polypterus senegalus TaxID=55291 RepID=UPI0019644841|nr:coiled-coil domain-containing protein 34-like [Polypterus senegalus]